MTQQVTAQSFKKWWVSALPLLTIVFTALAPTIRADIAAHPEIAGIVGGLYAILAHVAPSPVKQG